MIAKFYCAAVAVLIATGASAEPLATQRGGVNQVLEVSLESRAEHADPFNDVTLDAVVTTPSGASLRVPAFWAGGKSWKFRYSSLEPGEHRWQTEASETADAGLHGVQGVFRVAKPQAADAGRALPLRISDDRRHFVLPDGKPFLWIGDTCWMGLTSRLPWPDGFKHYVADRKAKGFNVVQIVAGLYPDMPPLDPRGENEAGLPWTKDYSTIRPEYFDLADRRIAHLVEQGITPCVVGAWGYHMPYMGVEKLSQHWRYVIARWGAYPVVWCAAGEVNLPYYLAPGFPFDDREQVAKWTEVTRNLRETDPFHRPISTHPTGLGRLSARGAIDDQSLIDFDMLQTGHGDMASLGPTIETARWTYAQQPTMPFLNSEVCYEGINGGCHDYVQRLFAWSSLLSGAAGHTYGANGIWQANQKGQPFGPSPHGGDYGHIPWDEALLLPGSTHVGIAGKILRGLPWERFEPHQEWATFEAASSPQAWGEWIWTDEGDSTIDAPDGARYFRRVFSVTKSDEQPQATLWIGCDNAAEVWLNGTKLGEQTGWQPAGRFAIDPKLLKPGMNCLAVRAENQPAPFEHNPAGLLATLELKYSRSDSPVVQSDDKWRWSAEASEGWLNADFNDGQWGQVRKAAEYGAAPWGPAETSGNPFVVPYSAGLPDGSVRLIYVPASSATLKLHHLGSGAKWRTVWIDPRRYPVGLPVITTANNDGDWQPSLPESGRDWLLHMTPAAGK